MDRCSSAGRCPPVPQAFLDMPRWWRDGRQWLDELPRLARTQCARWRLELTGEVAHGSNAVVFAVSRAGDPFVLRLTPPGPEVAAQVGALRFWAGRGTVRLIEADVAAGAMLLERLAATTLHDVPVGEAVALLGRLMRRLAVPAPPQVPGTAAVVAARLTELRGDWRRLGRLFDASWLRQAMAAGARLSHTDSTLAVNADLHSAQVLRGTREPWLVVDPVLMRGDLAFDLARVLWTRVDEMADAGAIRRHFEAAVAEAVISSNHGRDWVLFRAVDYWLWGLAAGLTEDPRRCRRLVRAFAD